MTFKTSLVLAGDDAGMSDVLAKADKALEQLERSTASLARAQAAAKSETDAAKAAYKSGELTLEQYNRTIIDSKTALSLFEERHRRAAAEVKSFGAVANVSTGQAKAGYINLGRQMQDVAVQMQSGTNIGTIIAQQGGQVADAVAMMGGKFSGFASFMAGPFGALITVGIGVLFNLVGAMRESGDAASSTGGASETLAQKLDLARHSFLEVTKAAAEYNAEQTKARQSTLDAAQAVALKASQDIKEALAIRQKLQAQLEANQASAAANAGQGTGGAAGAFSGGQVSISQAKLNDNLSQIRTLTEAANNAMVGVADEIGKINADPTTKIRAGFDKLRNDARSTIKDVRALTERLTSLNRQEKAAVDSIKRDTKKRQSPSGLFGREINMAEATSIAGRAGFQVNSGTRPSWIKDEKPGGASSQERLYNRWVAQGRPKDNPTAKPGTSAHEKSNALDIQFGKGVSPASIRKAFDAEGVRLTKILKERGHYHIEWSSKGADKLQREAEKIDNFGERAAESIARINAQFDAQPRLVDQAQAATAALDKTIADLRDKKPVNWEGMVADAQAAKSTIQEALVRPYQQLREESERRQQIDKLITSGREDEAAALQIIWQKEAELGPLSAKRKQDILEMVQHERAVTEELDRRRTVIGYYLDASRSIRDTFTEFFSTGSFNFKSIGQTFKRLNGQVITEQLFGGIFRDLDKWLKGQSGLSPSVDFISSETERAGNAIGALADAINSATLTIAGAGAGSSGSLEAQFDQAFGKQLAGGAVSSAEQVVSGLTRMIANGQTPNSEALFPKGSVMTLTPGIFFSELIRRASTGLKLNLSEDTLRGLGKFAQGGMWGQFGSQMVLGKSGGVGSFVGGAFGESIFKAAAPKLFKSLGSFAGPLGSIAGGILGGLIGGLFSKAKTGGVSIGAVNGAGAITGTGGNNAQLKGQMSGSGNSVNSTLAQIAQQLGGSIGNYSVAIGMRKDEFRVSASGSVGNTTAKKTGSDIIYKGKDEASAIQAALANAIQDGAIKGLSAAVQKALQSSSNIDQAIQEALKVQDVETAIGGIGAALSKQFADFEKQAAERLRIAQQYGFDVVAMEKRNAEDRLKLSQKLLAEQVGSLQQLIEDMTSGSLFEGSAVDQRKLLLDKIASTKAEADAGTEGAGDKLANLLQQLNAVSKDAFATTGEFAADRGTILDAARDTIAKANQRIADAQAGSDPALATTNATLDEIASQNAQALAQLGLQSDYLANIAANFGGGGGLSSEALAALARTSYF